MKKVLLLLLVVALVMTFMFTMVACNKDQGKNRKTIVYLGDSIAEAIIGPRPLSERDNYGYFALVGKMNDFNYYNHSVSGHQTSNSMLGDGVGLLEMVEKETENGALVKTHIQQADVIHISILGNNALQFDMGWLMLEAACPKYVEIYDDNISVEKDLLYYMVNGIEGATESEYTRTNLITEEEEQFKFPNTYENICDIVSRLKELNPTAKIVFQKVYNPVFEGTTLVNEVYWEELAKIQDTEGKFGPKGEYITTWAQRRAVAQAILEKLNGVLDTYNNENPGQINILDVNQYFSELAGDDLSENSFGAKLLYSDWTHPSNRGHAAIAAKTQMWLEEMGLANPKALDNYKGIKIEQINRMYAGIQRFDKDNAIAQINAGKSIQEVSNIYFDLTDDYLANYSRENLAYNRKGEKYFDKDTKFEFDTENVQIMSDNAIYAIAESAALNPEKCYFEFKKNGTMHAQLQTKDGLVGSIDTILNLFLADGQTKEDLLAGVTDLNLEDAIKSYVDGFFPGFSLNDLEGSLGLLKSSIGASLGGIDFTNDLFDYVKQNKTLPADVLDRLPNDLVLTLSLDMDYRIKEVKTAEGKTKTVIYLGKEVAANDQTQPFFVFEQKTIKNDDGIKIKHLEGRVDFIGVTIALNEIIG